MTFNEAKTVFSDIRVQLLLHALGSAEYRRLRGRLYSDAPQDKNFEELLTTLKDLFSDSKTFFQRRYDAVTFKPNNLDIDAVVDEVSHVEGDLFGFDKLNIDKFKLLLAALWMNE